MIIGIIFNFFLIFFAIFLIKIVIKNKVLLSDTGDKHQKFISKIKVPLIGGLILLSSILFLDIHLNYKIAVSLIFSLGLVSDLKILSSANIRFFLQCILIFFCVLLLELKIINTRILFLDTFLENKIFNIFFVSFCIIIIINGTNFIDGINLNAISYYFIINLILLYLSSDYELLLDKNKFITIGVTLLILAFFNFKNLLFLGDNGSYLLGLFYSIILIDFYKFNQEISPFFIILVLWYPSFENLFSILRKFITKNSPFKPDNLHLHHLIHIFFKKNFFLKKYINNSIGIIINLFNLLVFCIGIQNINHTKNLITLIAVNTIIYLVIYFKLFNKKSL